VSNKTAPRCQTLGSFSPFLPGFRSTSCSVREMPGCRLLLTVTCACRSHASSCVSGVPLPADVGSRATRRTYADRNLAADSGGAVSTMCHPHVPASVRAVLGGGEADAVRGWLMRLFLPTDPDNDDQSRRASSRSRSPDMLKGSPPPRSPATADLRR
jgi:hypothetical protein